MGGRGREALSHKLRNLNTPYDIEKTHLVHKSLTCNCRICKTFYTNLEFYHESFIYLYYIVCILYCTGNYVLNNVPRKNKSIMLCWSSQRDMKIVGLQLPTKK